MTKQQKAVFPRERNKRTTNSVDNAVSYDQTQIEPPDKNVISKFKGARYISYVLAPFDCNPKVKGDTLY